MRDGVPYSNRASTLSLLPGAAVAEWLDDNKSFVGGRLLDCGCGNRPYGPWYAPLVKESVGLDAAPSEHIDVIGFADSLPFAQSSFDTVLCTEVLEHVTDAERAAAELFRVAKPGGHVLVTVPYLYPTHEAPYDNRRFTHFGLQSLLERAGFDVVSVDAKGGFGLMASHYLVLAVVNVLDAVWRAMGGRRPLSEARWIRPLLWAPQEARIRARRIPRRIRGSAERTSLGYMAVARKP
jgi:SAM-dependent methyltransferase